MEATHCAARRNGNGSGTTTGLVGSLAGNGKNKRPRDTSNWLDPNSICSFCATVPACVTVMLPVLGRTKRSAQPFCLCCYYTSSAVRQDAQNFVTVLNQEQVDLQLPDMQQLFSEAYLELAKEIGEETARAFQTQRNSVDPLAALLHPTTSSKTFRKSTKNKASTFASSSTKTSSVKRGPPPLTAEEKKAGKAQDGGFLREVQLPERLLKTQQQQARLQRQQVARMNRAAATSASGLGATTAAGKSTTLAQASSNSSSKRRKGSGRSIWNMAMDGVGPELAEAAAAMRAVKDRRQDDGDGNMNSNNYHDDTNNAFNVVCSCGSQKVRSFGNVTSRNQDVRKGEIWGTDRDAVVNRYQCNQCGKMWNEEE